MTRLRTAIMVVVCLVLSCRATQGDMPPEAGGPTALPKETTRPVPLINGGFEEGLTGWTPATHGAFSVVNQAALVHRGTACLRFDATQEMRFGALVRQALPDTGPGVYLLRFHLKTRDISGKAKGISGVRVSIEYHLRNGKRVWPSTRVFDGTADWREVELKVYVPPDMKPGSALISIHRYGVPTAGEAFFDDFSLARVEEPPVDVFLLYPNWRGYLPENGPQRVRLWVTPRLPQTRPVAKVRVQRADTGAVLVPKILSRSGNVVELDATAWPTGRYLVTVQAGDYRSPAYAIQKITAAERRRLAVWFDAAGVMHVHGKPTFPIGLYNTMATFAWESPDFDVESARLTKMTEAPVKVNVNYWWWPCGVDVRRRYLAELDKHGILYLDTVNNVRPGFPRTACATELVGKGAKTLATQDEVDRYVTALAGKMRTMPGFLGWYAMDERAFHEVPRQFHRCRLLRQADPDHPVFGVSNLPSQVHFWRDTLDIIGVDPYPLMNMKAGRPLSLVGDWTRAGVDATRGTRPVWTVIQFFQGWRTDRWPTEEELRTMSLMAITEGARGLLYWSFGARALMNIKDPKEREAYWRRLVSVTKELKSIEPALLAPDAPGVLRSVSDPRIRRRTRIADGKCFIFAYLPADKFVDDPANAETVTVTFTLADGRTVRRTFRPDSADWFSVPAP